MANTGQYISSSMLGTVANTGQYISSSTAGTVANTGQYISSPWRKQWPILASIYLAPCWNSGQYWPLNINLRARNSGQY